MSMITLKDFFCDVLENNNHLAQPEITSSTDRSIQIKWWERGWTCICSDLRVSGYINYPYLNASLSWQMIYEWNLMKLYSFSMNEICNLIKIFMKYKWTEFAYPEQKEYYSSTWCVACEGSRRLIVYGLCI